MPRPIDWKVFVQAKKEGRVIHGGNFAIFAARYSLATKFKGLRLENTSDQLTDFYSAVTKLSLAYAALDYLEKLLGDSRQNQINSPSSARALRGKPNQPLVALVLSQVKGDALRANLGKMLSGGNDDIRPFVYAMRNSLFHGEFTPSSTGMRTSRRLIKLFDEVSSDVLSYVDSYFSENLFNGTIIMIESSDSRG